MQLEEYKSNSYKSKEETKPAKKVEKVVTGAVKTKKKSEIRKFTDIFISEDVGSVKSYIFTDVLVPAIKKAIYDVVTNGIDMILYSGSGEHSKKRSTVSRVSYDQCSKKVDRRDYSSNRSRTTLDYDDILFDNRGDAEVVLSTMEEMIDRYGFVSVGDLYDLAEISTSNYMVNKYGWADIHSATVVHTRDGYMIKLPRALPLD